MNPTTGTTSTGSQTTGIAGSTTGITTGSSNTGEFQVIALLTLIARILTDIFAVALFRILMFIVME